MAFYESFPPCSGSASVTYHCARYAPGANWLIQLGDRAGRETTADGVRVISLPGSQGRIGKLLATPRRIMRIVAACEEIRPDVVVLEGGSWAMYHWLLLRQLRRRLAARVVYHSHNVEYLLRRDRNGALIAALTKWAEARLVREADVVFACSAVDQSQLESLYGRRPHVLPNSVDVDRFAGVPAEAVAAARARHGLGDCCLLFMGLYEYPPNTEAVEVLVRDIFPRVRQHLPKAKLLVVGGNIPHQQPWLIAPGRVAFEELPAIVAACSLGIAPIWSGSGTRLKILEYMAAGLPVVSTPKGAEGLELTAGEHLWIAAEPEGLADVAVGLLKDPAVAARIARAGQQEVCRRYSWPAILQDCWKLIESQQ